MVLARLSEHRKLDVGGLSRLAEVGESEVQAEIDGVAPSPSLIRRLAPALRLNAADLFVIAGMAVPDDSAPLDAGARVWVRELIGHAVWLSPERRRRLSQLVRSLPQEDRTRPVPPPRAREQYPPGSGAMLVRLLGNRNLDWTGAVWALAHLTSGSVYLSASSIGMVGHGRKELTPDLLAGFATLLGIPADELAAITGLEPADIPPKNPAADDVAELIWEVRRLTADQVRQVCDKAKSMRQE